jgi:ribosomal protein L14E/L6E/L27E
MSNGESVGRIAISRSGHDKGVLYVITGVVDDKFVLVADGENRPLSRPKRKNICHLSVTNHRTAATSDIETKKALKNFKEKK